MNLHEFYIGKAFDAYEYFGAHITKDGVLFRVYAPCAEKIELIGEFNDWDGSEDEMIQDAQSGVFECVQEDAEPGMMYKYRIYQKDGIVLDRFDPYSFGSQVRPDTASIIVDLDQYHFSDSAWIKKRCKNYDLPVNIYEVHAGSWRKNEADEENGWYHYNELARQLIPYIKEMGYTHVEFLPLTEHPADCSWGYQASGYFCPTSRYGTAGELMEMVDLFHKEGIGVIMDFVPVHFISDTYALNKFDGTALYEYADEDKGYSEWGTCNFNYYRGEVRSFLQSSANFWMEKFHFDGIRMDAISNAIYWQGDSSKGINEGALDFIKCMNSGLQKLHPSVMLIAEDSTNFPKVTAPVEYDGLGFDYKWDMGWMNDTLNYFRTAPEYRPENYHKLTFSMMYYYDARFLLPLSHDEVVHGKATIMQKMSGDYEYKFPQARSLYMYMYAHPGKKLNFMGNEIGQFREWDEKREQDWMLLDYPLHAGFARFMKDLNKLYLEHSAFWEKDYEADGFQWIDCHQEGCCIYVFERRSKKERMISLFNFSDQEQVYELHISDAQKLKELLNSNLAVYGGTQKRKSATKAIKDGKIVLTLPPYSSVYYLAE